MKKIICLLFIVLLLCGCENKSNLDKEVKDNTVKEEVVENFEVYEDKNTTPIGIYKLNGNKLTRLDTINTNFQVEGVIDTFQIYPSNEKEVILNNSFGTSYFNEWNNYKSINNNIKLGFNIKFKLKNGEDVSYNIYGPDNTFDKWEYLMNYLYDDYNNQGKSFYSHIESNRMTENTLFTAFKMQMSYSVYDINSKITFSAFTYDSDDDIDNNEYIGNSIHTINICFNGISCD